MLRIEGGAGASRRAGPEFDSHGAPRPAPPPGQLTALVETGSWIRLNRAPSRSMRRLCGIILVALGAMAAQHGLGCVDQSVCLGYALSQRLLAGLDFLLMLEAALGAVGFFGHLRATLHCEGGFIPHN
ncbi:MAG TPA: hypothetical protein VEZ70_00875 [Allosphingosinicella sp.]|nr:hypothetical protein [Allosphingosinicella sp.]